MGEIVLAPDLSVDERLLTFSMVQAGGPGGQNVNKVATAVLLRFRYNECEALSERARERLRQNFGSRINSNDELLLVSREYRTQEQNRTAAIRNLGEILLSVIPEPKIRIPTKAPKTPKGGGGPSSRREEPKKLRYYDPDYWE
ncbi:MAG: aminoacyl-tRNA hydrolase [Anaerolineaceae bacterium]|nr:aminoacyl-tRNA hydrolase [Anaerolineaceae bacterium]